MPGGLGRKWRSFAGAAYDKKVLFTGLEALQTQLPNPEAAARTLQGSEHRPFFGGIAGGKVQLGGRCRTGYGLLQHPAREGLVRSVESGMIA